MRVIIENDLCTACGLCTDSVPEVFQMGDEVAQVIQSNISEELEEAVRDAAGDCPVEAIIVEE